MGTFKITTPVSTGSKSGGPYTDLLNGNSNDGALIAGLLADITLAVNALMCGVNLIPNIAVNGSIIFNFDQNSAIISLDGNPAISFNSLPAGFTPLSCVLAIKKIASGTQTLNLKLGANTSSAISVSSLSYTSSSFAYDFSSLPPTMLDIILNGFGFQVTFTDNNEFIALGSYSFTGTYNIQQLTISGLSVSPTTNVKAGDIFTINATSGLLDIKSAQVQYLDGSGNSHTNTVFPSDFISLTDTQVVFLFPQFGNLVSGSSVNIYIFGVSFTGSILAGTTTVTFVDGSGIYTLVPLKSTDTVYDRSVNGATKKINIPNPFIETSFLP